MDVEKFFDHLQHGWLLRFLEHRIADKRVIRLIRKWLRAGVMDEGRWYRPEEGSPQGSAVSPLLANIYLHYVFDLWSKRRRRTQLRGAMIMVRYGDDMVVGFQHREEAEAFLQEVRRRFNDFGLQLHSEKTRLIEFGRFAAAKRKAAGESKPETFNFLGFSASSEGWHVQWEAIPPG